MASILRLGFNILKPRAISSSLRSLSVSPALRLKEIREEQNGKELIIQGFHVQSERAPYMIKLEEHKCPLCSLDFDVKHTDVLIVSQFVRSDGCMLPRRVTGLCRKQQKRMSAMVSMAQKAGLMPNLTPAYSKKDPKKRYGWKKYNKYFDESTIKARDLPQHLR